MKKYLIYVVVMIIVAVILYAAVNLVRCNMLFIQEHTTIQFVRFLVLEILGSAGICWLVDATLSHFIK